MNEFHRDNHFVPQSYLKRWSDAEGRVATYRTLVSHERVPLWSRHSPKSIAYHEYLYTRAKTDGDDDGIERWLERDFETPAEEPLERAVTGKSLTPHHWRALIRYVAAQDVRTPKRMRWQMRKWEEILPGLVEASLQQSVRTLESIAAGARAPEASVATPESLDLPIRLRIEPNEDGSGGTIGAEYSIGRAMWLFGIQRLLTHTLKVLLQHRWTIVHPATGTTFFTSDAPVLRPTFNSLVDYGLDGGWGQPGHEIMMPLGPNHLLYTQIGRKVPPRGSTLGRTQTELIRRFMAENADRFVFAAAPDKDVALHRARVVDNARFKAEAHEWAQWHVRQRAVELAFEASRKAGPFAATPPAAQQACPPVRPDS